MNAEDECEMARVQRLYDERMQRMHDYQPPTPTAEEIARIQQNLVDSVARSARAPPRTADEIARQNELMLKRIGEIEAGWDRNHLPPNGIEPIDEYDHHMLCCRHANKTSFIVYPSFYKPEDDEWYEDPEDSCFAWQNQEDEMIQLGWLRQVYKIVQAIEPKTHERVQSLIEVQPETEFPVLELIPQGPLSCFFEKNSYARVPRGQGSENPFTLQLRWALNIASGLVFLHTKNLIYDNLSPKAVCLRDDFSAVLTRLSSCAYEEQNRYESKPDGYYAPRASSCPTKGYYLSYIKPYHDIYAFGSFLYYLVKGSDPPADDGKGSNYVLVEGVLGADIIVKCWKKEYATMEEVLEEMRKLVVDQGLELIGDDIKVDESVRDLKGTNYWTKMDGAQS